MKNSAEFGRFYTKRGSTLLCVKIAVLTVFQLVDGEKCYSL